jgi:hypothetical protein
MKIDLSKQIIISINYDISGMMGRNGPIFSSLWMTMDDHGRWGISKADDINDTVDQGI